METRIKPAEYKEVDITSVAEAQQHLTLSERNKLQLVLTKFQRLLRPMWKLQWTPYSTRIAPKFAPLLRKTIAHSSGISRSNKSRDK
jgi:hypothetical protein